MRPVVWFSEPALQSAGKRIAAGQITSQGGTLVTSFEEYARASCEDHVVSFVDQHALPALTSHETRRGPVIVVCTETLPSAVAWLEPHPWLNHVLGASFLDHPMVGEHLRNVLASTTSEPRLLDWFGEGITGRRVRLSHASRRIDRLERMSEWFANNGAGRRTIELLRDAAEELLTNAFYDAPVAAGAFEAAISREVDVALPDEYACDLAYASREDLSIVRVRDPFGSLSRRRLVQVLSRCARTDMQVEVDESMGGAGLGMWRIFSNATFVAVSVVKHHHTEILVGIAKRVPGPKPFAFHLYFRDPGKLRSWSLLHDESVQPASSKSVLLELKSE
jgi:hypothetical protein